MNAFEQRERLKNECRDREYRQAYSDSFLDSWIATQVCVLRQQRGWTQAHLAERCGTKQPGIARLESADKRKVNLGLLRRVAAAFDLRLRVSFEAFATLLDDAEAFGRRALERPSFEEDPAFWLSSVPDLDRTSDPVSLMALRVSTWANHLAPAKLLHSWLTGADLPAVGHDEEPFRWVIRGIPQGAQRAAIVSTMATRVATLLQDEPDLRASMGNRDYLYNLLHLAAALETPSVLEEPLLSLYTRLKERSHLEVDVRAALVAALIRNQKTQALHHDWLIFLKQRKHDLLPGNEHTGWAGARRLPKVSEGRPDWGAVGEALRFMAGHLQQSSTRDDDFNGLLTSLLELYGNDALVHKEILRTSFDSGWPDWAKALVPRLFVLDTEIDERSYYLMAVPPYLFRVSWNPASRQGAVETLVAPEESPAMLPGFKTPLEKSPTGSDRLFFNWLRTRVQPLERNRALGIAKSSRRLHLELLSANPGIVLSERPFAGESTGA